MMCDWLFVSVKHEFKKLCTYQWPSQGVNPRDIPGNSAGFVDFCCQFVVRDGLDHFCTSQARYTGKDLRDL